MGYWTNRVVKPHRIYEGDYVPFENQMWQVFAITDNNELILRRVINHGNWQFAKIWYSELPQRIPVNQSRKLVA